MLKYTSTVGSGDIVYLVFPEKFINPDKIVGLGMAESNRILSHPFQKGNRKRLLVVDIPRDIFEFLKAKADEESKKLPQDVYPRVKVFCGCEGAYLRPALKAVVLKQLERSVLAKYIEPVVLHVNYGEPWFDGSSGHIPSYSISYKSFQEVFRDTIK